MTVPTAVPAPVASLPADALRRTLGQFPTGVTIATARLDDRLVGMTANSFSSVSLDPPLVLWSVARSAPSYPAFAAAGGFAIHLLGADHHDLALRFAGRGPEKFAGLAFHEGVAGSPVIEGLAPVFECRTWARYDGGDHLILVGEVAHMVERVQDPLLFHSGVLRRMEGSPRRPRDLPQGSFAKSYLAYLLARASDLVSREFHAALKGFGLTVPEWRVLACLTDAEGLGVGELAAMALMKQPRITKLLDRMERDGLVARRPDPEDRRRVTIHLTAAGRARAAPVLVAAKDHEAAILAPFSGEERAQIKHALDLLIGRDGASDAAG